MLIERPGFQIRSYRHSDLTALVRHADNPRVAENLRDRFPHPYTVADARDWLSVAMQQEPEANFAIAVDGELVGTIGLQVGNDVYRQSAEIGYWLGEDYWGRGIATEAVRAMTEWGFDNLGLLRIYALVFAANPASARVLEKAGYSLEGRMRNAVVKRGRVMDQLLLAIVAPPDVEPSEGEASP